MMLHIKNLSCVLLIALLAACGGLPKHKEITTDNPSTLEIIGAPDGAQLWVDGNLLDSVEKSKARYRVVAGTHNIRITAGADPIYEREIFIEKGSIRQINLKKK